MEKAYKNGWCLYQVRVSHSLIVLACFFSLWPMTAQAQSPLLTNSRQLINYSFAEPKEYTLPKGPATRQEPEEEETESRGDQHGRFPNNPEWDYTQPQLLDLIQQQPGWAKENEGRSQNQWNCIGPYHVYTNDNATQLTGRVRQIETYTVFSNTELGIKLCTGTGGIWRLDHRGGQTVPVSLQGDLPLGDVATFATNPRHPNEMLAGTGEPYAGIGGGIYKTTDNGNHWVKSLTGANTPFWFHKIVYSVKDSLKVYAASRNGFLISYDKGFSFNNFHAGDVTDMAVDIQHPDTFYFAVWNEGLYRTTNGGSTWNLLPNFPTNAGHVALSVSASSPNLIYAIATNTNYNACNTKGIYKSTDYGINWTTCSIYTEAGLPLDTNSVHWNQGYYNNCISINPFDETYIIAGAGPLLRSADGGNSFHEHGVDDMHHDHHGFAWSPNGLTLYQANDGGIFSSTDKGLTWSSQYNWLPITQYYEMETAHRDARYIYGSTQDNSGMNRTPEPTGITDSLMWKYGPQADGWCGAVSSENPALAISQNNGTIFSTSNGSLTWHNEGDFPHPAYNFPRATRSNLTNSGNPNSFYLEMNKQLFARNTSGNWVSSMGPTDLPDTIFYHAIGNRNDPSDRSNFYVSMRSSHTDKIYVYDRNNGNWFDITRNLPAANNEFYRVYTHYYNYDDAYAVRQGPATGPRIFKTSDACITDWRNITGDFPNNIKINALMANPNDTNQLFLGTYRMGVWRSDNGGTNWYQWKNGMPSGADASALDFIDSTALNGKLYIVASTYGRSIWTREITGTDPQAIAEINNTSIQFSLANFAITKSSDAVLLRGAVSAPCKVSFCLFDLSGKEIANIPSEPFSTGLFTREWNIGSLASGVYLCAMRVNNTSQTVKRLVVIP